MLIQRSDFNNKYMSSNETELCSFALFYVFSNYFEKKCFNFSGKHKCLSCKYLQRNHYEESNKVDFIQYFHSPMVSPGYFHLNYLFHHVSELYQKLQQIDQSSSNYSLKLKNFK